MHEKNIEILREEALRLIAFEQELLQKMLDEPGILTEARTDEKQSLDISSAKKAIEVLQGEVAKLENLEMVLAVVGTMKAGKSTTINAIVGTEVLPNRNAPMTAIPTLIRHTPGQRQSRLTFKNHGPLDKLMNTLHGLLNDARFAETLADIKKGEDDLHELIEKIRNREGMLSECEGPDAIFSFLKGVNDLVRLSPKLGVDFPFSDYDEVHELPVIEVEFAHLQEIEKSPGRLTLLDTPGPNEAGQSRLRPMLKDQLEKASAVLAVLDYTQMKSEADAQVRADIEEIADVAAGRLYALVNKFDQKDRNGMDKDEVRVFVSNLMDELIAQNKIFPVSSKYAYLANRAKHELSFYEQLPNPEHQPWVADFGELALGRRWSTKIGDAEEVIAAANALWDDSYFHEPLDGIIKMAHANAAILALDSAASKIHESAEDINNLCYQRKTALLTNAERLKGLVLDLREDIEKIKACEIKAHKNQKKYLEGFSAELKGNLEKLREEAKAILNQYFQEGKLIEKTAHAAHMAQGKKRVRSQTQTAAFAAKSDLFDSFNSTLSKLNSRTTSHDQYQDFDPKSPMINFYDDRAKAEQLISQINRSVERAFLSVNMEIERDLDSMLKKFESSFQNEVVAEADKSLTEIKNTLSEGGFENLHLDIPQRKALKLNLSGTKMLANAIDAQERSVTRLREQSGVWGSVKRGFGWFFRQDDWGHDEYSYKVTDYKIDMKKVRQEVLNSLQYSFKGLEEALTHQVEIPLQASIENFFAEFRHKAEQIRGNFLQSLRDQEMDAKEQENLLQRLKDLNKGLPGLLSDSGALKQDVDQLLPNTEPV
jgi:replication fork clamp-binding protein CrfC